MKYQGGVMIFIAKHYFTHKKTSKCLNPNLIDYKNQQIIVRVNKSQEKKKNNQTKTMLTKHFAPQIPTHSNKKCKLPNPINDAKNRQ